MGFGQLDLVDPDLVEDSNRNRQLFTSSDVGRPKAHRVLKNLEAYVVSPAQLRGYFMTFEEWTQHRRRPRYNVVCCGVDSLRSMLAVARYGIQTDTTLIFTNVSRDGEACRVFIQRRGKMQPCFACYLPSALERQRDRDQPCLPVPAIADILQVAVGFGARAAVGEILGTPIGDYNCRDLTFTGFDLIRTIRRRPGCPLCLQFKSS